MTVKRLGYPQRFLGAALVRCCAVICFSTLAHAETIVGSDLNSAASSNAAIAAIYSANRGSNGGGDQSLQFGDSLIGGEQDDILIGGLGVDALFGGAGDDVLIGGTEDFNSANRDRAFGDAGDDSFIWAPGDGNDFFDGGEGTDVVLFAVLGESTDPIGNTVGAPFFAVSPPGTPGSGDFDGIEIVNDNPLLNIAGGPGFCEIVERDVDNADALDELNLDHLIRFVLRGPRAAFINATTTDPTLDPNTLDNGLRVAVHLRNVEFLVCASEAGGETQVFDLRQVPAIEVDVSQLPARANTLVTQ